MPPRITLALSTLAAVGCFGLAPAFATTRIDPAAGVSARPLRQLVGMPDVSQPNSYTCGAASIEAVASYYGFWGHQEEYAKGCGTSPEMGTHPVRMATYLKTKLGLDARVIEGMTIADLQKAVDAGHAVIIDFQAYGGKPGMDYNKAWEDGHYCVVVGYNRDAIFLEDPSILGSLGYVTNKDLLTRWHDYETENGKRHDYLHLGIVVKGKPVKQPAVTRID